MGFETVILFHAALTATVLVEVEDWRGSEKFVALLDVDKSAGASGTFGSRSFPHCSVSASLTVNCGGSFLCIRGTSPCSSDCKGSYEDGCAEIGYTRCGSGSTSEAMLRLLPGWTASLCCVWGRVFRSDRGAGCDVIRRVRTWSAICGSRAQDTGSAT